MGSNTSIFSQNEIDMYKELTGLNIAEITHAYKRFKNVDPLGGFERDKKGQISFIAVAEHVKELKTNPLRYRICKIFCCNENGFMTFDDFLDMVSVFSDKCPREKKVQWAFTLYDFNENGTIDIDDMNTLLDTLTKDSMEQHLKDDIISRVLNEIDSDGDNAISYEEFERVMFFEPEFYKTFRFQL